MVGVSGAAERQAGWVVGAAVRAPLPEQELRDRMTPASLEACGGPAGFNPVSRASARSRSTGPSWPDRTWAELDGPIAAPGTRVSFVAAEIGPTGELDVVHGVDADVLRPVGSVFKLYVLGALAQGVRDGRASWDEPLAVRDEWEALPSGRLQDWRAGDELPLVEFADLMISISDNTATDHLIHRLGRGAVHRQLEPFGHQRGRGDDPVPHQPGPVPTPGRTLSDPRRARSTGSSGSRARPTSAALSRGCTCWGAFALLQQP